MSPLSDRDLAGLQAVLRPDPDTTAAVHNAAYKSMRGAFPELALHSRCAECKACDHSRPPKGYCTIDSVWVPNDGGCLRTVAQVALELGETP